MTSFSAIEYLVHNILNTHFGEFGDLITREEIEILHSDKEAYENRKKDICDDIKTKNMHKVMFEYHVGKFIAIPCPKCSEKYLINEHDSKMKCLFCGEQYNSLEDLYAHDRNCNISDYMERELRRREIMIDELRECVGCNYWTLILDKSNYQWKCGACGKDFSDEEIMYYREIRGREDWEAEVADMMEDPHYSHLWK